MAPTEILAEQHYRKLASWLDGLRRDDRVAVGLAAGEGAASGARSARERRSAVRRRHARAVPGRRRACRSSASRSSTSSIASASRSGSRCAARGMAEAHQLMMSATPIPRTLAMTFYADLDVSVLDEMPPGRTPVVTRLVSQKRRAEIVAWVGKHARERPAGLLGLPADRGIGEARAADGGRAACRARPRRYAGRSCRVRALLTAA